MRIPDDIYWYDESGQLHHKVTPDVYKHEDAEEDLANDRVVSPIYTKRRDPDCNWFVFVEDNKSEFIRWAESQVPEEILLHRLIGGYDGN